MADSRFLFDPMKNDAGEHSAEHDGKTYVFHTYLAQYCDTPYTDEWENASEYFKLVIKVPVSIGGKPVEQDFSKAPMLFYIPWGGDRGWTVGAPSALSSRGREADANVICEAFDRGWVVVEPGMRGAANCFAGQPGQPGFRNYGKLPGPLADLKAAIRYLRYGTNEKTIPGDKERIWVTGSSSGGCGTTIIGTSGNSPFFEEALKEIGALPGRDDVYGGMPSCPVTVRSWGDPAICWERWGDAPAADADAVNAYFAKAFAPWFNALQLKADHDCGSIKKGDLLTTDNYAEYLMQYVLDSGLKFLKGLGGRKEIEAYLAEKKPANPMYENPETSRGWITPVFDENDELTEIRGSWKDFWTYVIGEEAMDPKTPADLQYERAVRGGEEIFCGNGILNEKAGDRFSKTFNASTPSFGRPEEYGAVFSHAGQKYLQEVRGMEISGEYLQLIDMQRNSVDPMYFVLGEGAKDADCCRYWYMRAGSVDLVIPIPILIALTLALQNTGRTVDTALVWEQGHGVTDDYKPFFPFAEACMAAEK